LIKHGNQTIASGSSKQQECNPICTIIPNYPYSSLVGSTTNIPDKYDLAAQAKQSEQTIRSQITADNGFLTRAQNITNFLKTVENDLLSAAQSVSFNPGQNNIAQQKSEALTQPPGINQDQARM